MAAASWGNTGQALYTHRAISLCGRWASARTPICEKDTLSLGEVKSLPTVGASAWPSPRQRDFGSGRQWVLH